MILINSFTVVVRAKLIINIDFKSQAIAGFFATMLSSFISIYLLTKGYDIWALIILILTKSIFLNLGLWYFCKWFPKIMFSTKSLKELLKFGLNLMIAGIGSTLINNIYIALIGRYLSATNVGFFTQANNLSNFLTAFISSTLQGVTYPIMTSIKEDEERLLRVYKELISVTMLVSLPLLIGFAAIAENFVLLILGSEWLPSVSVLTALCLARSITPISGINLNILNAIGRSDLFLKVDLVKYPMTIIAFFIAIDYGIDGIACAVVSTSFISFFINSYYPGKFFSFGGLEQLRIAYKYIIAAIIMFISVNSLYLDGPIWLNLIFQIILGILIYPIILYLLHDKFFIKNVRILFNNIFILKRKF